MTNLVSMYGSRVGAPQYQFSLFSMSGRPAIDPTKIDPVLLKNPIFTIDPRELDNLDAGIQVIYAIAYKYPGITWGELLKMSNRMGNIFTDFGSWVGNGISDAGDKIGEWGGDTIRLLTDKEVQSGIQNFAAAYATGGKSLALQELIGSDDKENSSVVSDIRKFLVGLGKKSKENVDQASTSMDFGDIDPKWLAIGMGSLILLVLLFNWRK